MELGDVAAFVAVARGRGFREAARASGSSASTLSEAVRRLEAQVGVRLLNRTTRSVSLTEAGARLLERLLPALGEVEAALDVVNGFRESPKGSLRLNVPSAAVYLFLPAITEAFMHAHPEVKLEITVDDSFVDVFAAGCDAGIRYDERLEQDMIAVPIGPRRQRFALGASPAYLAKHGAPQHPYDLLNHACIRQRFASGAMPAWPMERDGELLQVDPSGPLIVTAGAAEMSISAAAAGLGIVFLFEDWLRPAFTRGALLPVLEDWWHGFSGPFLYYPSRRFMPSPLRAFVDFIQRPAAEATASRVDHSQPPGAPMEPTEHRSDSRSIAVAATPAQVFAALADPSRVARWWGPEGFSNTIHQFDFRPGGNWLLTMHGPDGTDYPNESRFTRIVPGELFEIEHLSGHHFTLSIELQSSDEGTRVHWRQTFDTVEHYEQIARFVATANQQNLERLAAEVLRGS